MEYLHIASEGETLLYIGSQGDFVGEIELSLQVERTAVDEIVAVMECRTVGQHILIPVDRLISGKCGYSTVKVVSISFFGFSVTPAKLTILRNPDEVLPKVVPCLFNIC